MCRSIFVSSAFRLKGFQVLSICWACFLSPSISTYIYANLKVCIVRCKSIFRTWKSSQKWTQYFGQLLKYKVKLYFCQFSFGDNHSFWMAIVEAPPPPLQRLATPISPCLSVWTKWFVILTPDIPKGCPTPIAPPFILT